jgi:hypothetical protein
VILTAEVKGEENKPSDTASITVSVVYRPLETAPVASGRLASDGTRLFAAFSDADSVVVVENNAVVGRIEVCSKPVSVSVNEGILGVICREDRLQWWDSTRLSLIAQVELRWGAKPEGGVVEPGGSMGVTLAGTGELIRVQQDGSIETLTALVDARAVAGSEGNLYGTRFKSTGESGEVAGWTASGTVDFSVPKGTGPDSDTDARGVPTYLAALAISPDGRTLAVGGLKANIERGLARDGLPLTNETAVRSTVRLLDRESGAQTERSQFDNRDQVGALCYSPQGELLFVAHRGAGIVDIVDPVTLTRLGGFQGVGVGLDGVVVVGDTLYVLASWDRQLVGYDLTSGNAQVEVARLDLLEDEPLDETLLLGGRLFHAAGDPRISQDGYISCASCHLDGDSDGQTWDFTDRGEGLRNTLPLFAMPPNGPYHWSANFDELQDFENDIRNAFGGTGLLSEEDWEAASATIGTPKAGLSTELDALAAYSMSLAGQVPRSPYREENGEATEAGLRGAEVFEREGCDECHSGAFYTDAAITDGTPLLHDVGTLLPTSGQRLGGELTGLRTPGLRGIQASAPYLHDGRAQTLEEALGEHGVVLGEADLGDLVAFLRELE